MQAKIGLHRSPSSIFINGLIRANSYTFVLNFAHVGCGMLHMIKIEPLSCDWVFHSLVLKMNWLVSYTLQCILPNAHSYWVEDNLIFCFLSVMTGEATVNTVSAVNLCISFCRYLFRTLEAPRMRGETPFSCFTSGVDASLDLRDLSSFALTLLENKIKAVTSYVDILSKHLHLEVI